MARLPTTLNARLLAPAQTWWLAAGFLLASLSHLLRLPLWLSSLVGIIFLWRLYLTGPERIAPPKWLLILVALAAAVGILLQYRTLFGREAGVALLVVMLAMKLLETRNQRDGMLLGFLSCFMLVTNFLYSQTIPTAVYMMACAWVVITGLISLQYTGHTPGWRYTVKRSGLLLVQAIPLMLVLFLLFPRIQGPLWGLPHDSHTGLSGLSDTMSPGSLNNLILSDSVAFRASFVSSIPEARELYWRGPVLWDYDGTTWTAPRYTFLAGDLPSGDAAPVEYTVTLEPHNKRWLFALEFPGIRLPRSFVTRDMQLLNSTLVRNRMRYDMQSSLQAAYGIHEDETVRQRNLQLPAGYNPRTARYAQELRGRFKDDRQLVGEVLGRFRNDNFVYTLSPPLLGTHGIDEFLFDTRRGFCEHYASAFTVLMRAAGIPARVVTGYQGGQINPVGEYILVRQADAHAWTEIWLADAGWVRVDPTAAVSPARVERGIASALPRSDPLPMFVRGDFAMLQQMRLAWDSVTYTWNQWVLGYSPERQRMFLSRLGFSEATWQTLAVILVICAGIAVMIGAAFALRDLRRTRDDEIRAAYDRFCRKLARRGLRRGEAEGPRRFAERACRMRPELAPHVRDITDLYIGLRYGRMATADGLHELKQRIRRFAA